ncbi:MAG: DMT family transporter [Sediminibacterium sp.]|nr:DMT family transporter [Sediminibacterium sp.]
MTVTTKAYICLTFISIAWGTSWIANKYMLNLGVSPIEISFLRQIIAGLIFILYFLLIQKAKLPRLKQLPFLIIMGIITFVFSNAFSNVALKFIPSGLAALIAALYPLFIIIIEVSILRKVKLNLFGIIGIILGFIGISFVTALDHFWIHYHEIQIDNYFWIGIIVSVFSVLCWSIASINNSHAKIGMNNSYAVGWQMIFGALFLFLYIIISPQEQIKAVPFKALWALAYLIIMSNILCFIAFYYSIKHLGMGVTSLYAYINPLVTLFLGWLLLSERLTILTLIGTIITLVGVFFANKSLASEKEKIKTISDSEFM